MYSINFTALKTRFCLNLHDNGANSYLFVNCTEIIKFKAKDYETVPNPLCLGNISEDFYVDWIESVYDSSVDYDAIAVNNILDIHGYLIKKNGII